MPNGFEGKLFNIIHHRGDPQTAVTLSGHTVRRQEFVVVPEMLDMGKSTIVKCAPYDDHFLYLDPVNLPGHWFAMCTCGAPAVIIGTGMLVCFQHASTGKHTTGGSRWV
jgi:hypothetical protein